MTALLALLLAAAPGAAAPALGGRPLGMEEAYQLALRRSEELAQRGWAAAELEARVAELWSAVKPRVSLRGSSLVQDVPPAREGVSAIFTQRSREEVRLTLRQPLFSGLREFLAARATRAQTRSAELAVERARQRLFLDVAQAYVDLLARRRTIAIRESMVRLTQDRLEELRARRRVGRSRASELLAAEAQLAQIQAELQRARGAERAFQHVLRFLTGLDEELAPADLPAPALPELAVYVARAGARPDVEAARRELEAAGLLVDVQRRQAWPSLGLDGNYYLKRPPGFQDRVKWDVFFAAEIPLYAGGEIRARTRQADARRASAEEAASLARRRAELEVRRAHEELAAALSVAGALERAVELAQANARAQSEDYRLGMVGNLDVLGSLDALQEARLRLDEALMDAALARAELEVAAGGPPARP